MDKREEPEEESEADLADDLGLSAKSEPTRTLFRAKIESTHVKLNMEMNHFNSIVFNSNIS